MVCTGSGQNKGGQLRMVQTVDMVKGQSVLQRQVVHGSTTSVSPARMGVPLYEQPNSSSEESNG